MADWIIRPLHVGTIRRDKSIFTYLRNMGTQMDGPVLAWFLEGKGPRILIDTGGHDPAEGELHPPYSRAPEQHPVARLAALGVRPEDIDVLILTHLHWDHASNLHLFPRARVLVQRDELRYAVAPLAPHRWAYESRPPLALAADRLEVLDGDAEIAEGVSVHLTRAIPRECRGWRFGRQGPLFHRQRQCAAVRDVGRPRDVRCAALAQCDPRGS